MPSNEHLNQLDGGECGLSDTTTSLRPALGTPLASALVGLAAHADIIVYEHRHTLANQ